MKAKVTISRGSDDRVRIRFRDVSSGVDFVTVSLSAEAFGFAVTGLSEQEGEMEVRGIQWVGKRCITERRSIECPLDTYNKEQLSEWLRCNAQEDGWLLSSYLGSQSSITRAGGKTILNYSVTKYVDQTETEQPA